MIFKIAIDETQSSFAMSFGSAKFRKGHVKKFEKYIYKSKHGFSYRAGGFIVEDPK